VGVYGEQEHTVPPLPLPAAETTADLPTLGQNAAIRLFVARAQAVAPSFSLRADNAAAVTEICVRLEGLPLAIELAAARVRALPPAQILARLGDRLDFLQAQSRDGPSRQQTLRATLEWSYALLPPQEQKLLAWLSVFVGGASLEAITAVWQPDETQPLDVVDGLITLVSHSLVQAQTDDEMPRYGLLETVREYGREQLASRGESADVTQRYAKYFQQFVATRGANVFSHPTVTAEMVLDYPNMRTALDGALERRDLAMAFDMCKDLVRFWSINGAVREGWRFVQAVLALPLPTDAPRELQLQQARLQELAAVLGGELDEHALCRALLESALTTARAFEDNMLSAYCLGSLALYLDPINDYERCLAMLNEALVIYQRLENRGGMASIYIRLGSAFHDRQFYAEAQHHFEMALALFRDIGHRRGMVAALNNLGELSISRGQDDAAEHYLSEALAISYNLDNQQTIIHNLLNLSHVMLRRFDQAAARTYLGEALQRADQGGYMALAVYVIGYIGWLAEQEEQMEETARTLGAYDWLIAAHGQGQNAPTEIQRASFVAARERARA
ncbi:MAG: tetratricopeptide repeat protein, partial [Roseiflexaceae bacterium]|nr:tetratricopeptide repeat protein [Roseiflexaceae bacterium]